MSVPSPRPGILELSPYVGGLHGVSGVERPIILASNETPLGPSPKAQAAYRQSATLLHRYPDGGCTDLRAAIGETFECDPDRIVCGAGSDELIANLIRAYAGPGDEVLHSRHGFSIYPIFTRAAGATPVAAAERDLTADVDALLARVSARTRLVFLANPNNPTGTYLSADALVRLREGLRPDVLLVIDAAYAEYVGRNDYTAGADLVDRYDNVVMTRTFSKIFGLAAARLGWACCPAAVADVLNRLRAPFNVGAGTQAAGIAALADREHFEKSRVHNETWLPWLRDSLLDLGLEVPPSVGNFVLARFSDADQAAAAYQALLADGIITRAMQSYHLPDSLRISVGLERQNRALVDALARHLKA